MQQQRDIYVIGGGAIGKALAFFLASENRKVTLVRVQSHIHANDEELISLSLKEQPPSSCRVATARIEDLSEREGIFVVTSKSYGNLALARKLRQQRLTGPLVIMQNGLGVETPFLSEGFTEVCRCVLFATSQLRNEVVHFKPVASSPIGIVKGQGSGLQSIVSLLDSAYFRFHADADIETISWKKALSNIVFNSICPLLDVDNGIFARNGEVMSLADRIIEQCVQVARQRGIALTAGEIHDTVLLISRASDGQDISTLQDIRQGRETEINTLNMELCRLAQEPGLSEIVRETWLLGRMIQLKAMLHTKEKAIKEQTQQELT